MRGYKYWNLGIVLDEGVLGLGVVKEYVLVGWW